MQNMCIIHEAPIFYILYVYQKEECQENQHFMYFFFLFPHLKVTWPAWAENSDFVRGWKKLEIFLKNWWEYIGIERNLWPETEIYLEFEIFNVNPQYGYTLNTDIVNIYGNISWL